MRSCPTPDYTAGSHCNCYRPTREKTRLARPSPGKPTDAKPIRRILSSCSFPSCHGTGESAAGSCPTGSHPIVTKTEGCFCQKTLSLLGDALRGWWRGCGSSPPAGRGRAGWVGNPHAQGSGWLRRGSASLCADQPDTESSTVCYARAVLLLHR